MKKNLALAVNEITKEYGENAVRRASEVSRLPRIPTRIFSLDAYLGGGIPMSRITRLVGEPQGGKSTIAQFVAANAQRLDRDTFEPLDREGDTFYRTSSGEEGDPMQVVWLDAEGTFEPKWAETCGVDLDQMLYMPIAYMEQAYDALNAFIRTGDVDLVVLDSIAAMSPATERENSMEDQQMGISARVNNKGFRKMTAEFNRLVQSRPNAPAVILINQLREKIGVMFGNPETTPGGRGQEFFSSLDVKVWPQALGKATKDGDDIVARESTFKIQKNKVNGVYGEGKFQVFTRDYGMFRAGDTDEPIQVIDWAIRLGLVEQSGSWLILPDGQKVQGKNRALEKLLENPESYQSIRQETLKAVQGRYG